MTRFDRALLLCAVLGLLALTLACAPALARVEPQALTLSLMVSPQTAFYPTPVYARLIVHDPHRELVCPEWSIDWGESGTPSAWSSSCDPEMAATMYVEPREGPRRHHYFRPGTYVVRGRVTGQGVKREASRTVNVIGPDRGEP